MDVLDGDTISVIHKGSKKIVRLLYIDAPELEQRSFEGVPIGKLSKAFLQSLIQNKIIKIEIRGKGYYGRWLGKVMLKEQDINLLLVQNGMALLYPYSRFKSIVEKNNYLQAFYQARNKLLGIWGNDGFLAPRYFRKLKYTGKK